MALLSSSPVGVEAQIALWASADTPVTWRSSSFLMGRGGNPGLPPPSLMPSWLVGGRAPHCSSTDTGWVQVGAPFLAEGGKGGGLSPASHVPSQREWGEEHGCEYGWRSGHPISISADTMVGARGACYCWVGMKVPALLVVLSVSLAGRSVGCLVRVT